MKWDIADLNQRNRMWFSFILQLRYITAGFAFDGVCCECSLAHTIQTFLIVRAHVRACFRLMS